MGIVLVVLVADHTSPTSHTQLQVLWLTANHMVMTMLLGQLILTQPTAVLSPWLTLQPYMLHKSTHLLYISQHLQQQQQLRLLAHVLPPPLLAQLPLQQRHLHLLLHLLRQHLLRQIVCPFVKLSGYMFNARSVVSKVSELHYLLYQVWHDVYFITETWLHDDVCSGLLDPRSQFTVLRKDRTVSKGGGVCALIRSHLRVVPVSIADEFCDLELLCFDLITVNCRYRFCCGMSATWF